MVVLVTLKILVRLACAWSFRRYRACPEDDYGVHGGCRDLRATWAIHDRLPARYSGIVPSHALPIGNVLSPATPSTSS